MAELYRELFELTETERMSIQFELGVDWRGLEKVELANCHERGRRIQDMTMLLAKELTRRGTANILDALINPKLRDPCSALSAY